MAGRNNVESTAKARHLRHRATAAEKKLWGLLRSRRLAACKFRRQVSLGRFIVDLVCFEKRLVLELDGGHHQAQAAYDEQRTTWLESQGFRVLRFWNHQVLTEPAAVQEAILLAVGRHPPHPAPLPPWERERTPGEETMISQNHVSSSREHVSGKDASSAPVGGVPALVVSGFLGAGKTTLVRHLLAEARTQDIRLAVVSNEFGELGIDQALLGSQAGRNYVELEGGCVCCKLSDELVTTLQRIWEEIHPDRVIVETSGVALPFDTLLNFWREPVSGWVGDGTSVVVVNAEQVADGRDLEGTFEQQVSSADLLVLNKIDLIDANRLDRVHAVVKNLAPGAPIIRAVDANVSPLVLFPPDPDALPKRTRTQSKHDPHTHEAFETEEFVAPRGIAAETLIRRITSRRTLRAKGFVQTADGLRLVQGVGPRVDLVEPTITPPARLLGRVVLIRRRHDGS